MPIIVKDTQEEGINMDEINEEEFSYGSEEEETESEFEEMGQDEAP